ncbi:hypothetical protein BC940DRAFT_289388 [Gongronella butleri]|nr:hypothetical protein BC940DRAFT_289388 [Gongronella butleri]
MDFNSFHMNHGQHSTPPAVDPQGGEFFDFIDPLHFPSGLVDTHSSSNGIHTVASDILSPNVNLNEFQTPLQHPISHDALEDEEFFTPLISPAIPPNYYTNLRSDTTFSPLTSPALGPQMPVVTSLSSYQQSSAELQKQLDMIEQQQQQLRTRMSSPKQLPLLHQIHKSSQNQQNSPQQPPAPATPSLLMKLGAAHSSAHAPPGNDDPVDQMEALPAAILPPQQQHRSHQSHQQHQQQHQHQQAHAAAATMATPPSTSSSPALQPQFHHQSQPLPSAAAKPAPKRTKSTSSQPKRRRISHPRSTFTPPALRPQQSQNQAPHHHPGAAHVFPGHGMAAALVSPAALRPHPPPSPLSGPMVSPYSHPMVRHPSSGTITTTTSSNSSTTTSGSLQPNNNRITASPRALKPLISPSLAPNRNQGVDEKEAAALLASKSNYETLRDGRAKSLGIDFSTNIQSCVENRRSQHKVAEQKRRDILKQSFDALRAELLGTILKFTEDPKKKQDREKRVKQMSKVVLLQHSYDHLIDLKHDNERKDAKIAKLTDQVRSLRRQLGMDPVTVQEQQEAMEEAKRQEEHRQKRWKILDEMVTDPA